jgi:hypothetical protein
MLSKSGIRLTKKLAQRKSLLVRTLVWSLSLILVTGVLKYPAITRADSQEDMRVLEGRIINGTKEVGAEGLMVVLHENGISGRNERTATSGPSGAFRFQISYDAQVEYGVSVEWMGALYGTDLDLSGGSPEPVTLTVYDATSDRSVLIGGASSLLISDVDAAAETIWALEIVQIINESSLTYVPGLEPMNLIRFGLPPGAAGLQIDTSILGADVLQVDRGFALTASVPPGEYDIMFAYNFPYSGNETSFVKTIRYGASQIRVLASVDLVGLVVDELEGGKAKIGSREYKVYEGTNIPKETVLSVVLLGLPQASLIDRIGHRMKGMRFEYLAPIALGVMLATSLGLAVWKRRGTAVEVD